MTTEILVGEPKKKLPAKRNGYYFVAPEHQAVLGREKFLAVTTPLGVIEKGGMGYALARDSLREYMENPEKYQAPKEVIAAIQGRWRKKAELGKAIHSLAEAIAKGADVHPVDIHEGYATATRAFFLVVQPKVIEVEVNFYNTIHGYAGTADLLALVGVDEKTYLFDFKTTAEVYREAKLQLRAYRECDWMLVRGELKPVPPIDATAVILLREDGTYDFSLVDASLETFLHAKGLYEGLEAM